VGDTVVDTVAFSFPVRRPDSGEGASALVDLHADGERMTNVRTLRKLPSGGTLRSGVGGHAVVEVSAKYGVENNVRALPWVEAVANIEAAALEASTYVEPVTRWEDGHFVRVDTCRDFDGGHAWPHMAAALERAVYLPRARSRLFRDRARGNSLTLAVGHSGFRAAIYDKHRESMGAAPEGRLRYEVRNGRKWCQRLGVDLASPGVLDARAEWLFRESRFGAEVRGMTDVCQALLDNSGLSTREKVMMLGLLTAEAYGQDFGEHRNTTRKYRKLARDLGLTAFRAGEAEVIARLDWQTARVHVAVAA